MAPNSFDDSDTSLLIYKNSYIAAKDMRIS